MRPLVISSLSGKEANENMKTFLSSLLLVILVATASVSSGASKSDLKKITGIYSNMHYNEEGGDVLGIEIFLIYTAKGYFVVFQSSEGEPTIPVITNAKISDSHIEFILPQESSYAGKFTGRLIANNISGRFEGGDVITLKRKKSYWQ